MYISFYVLSFLYRGQKISVKDADQEVGSQMLTQPIRAYTSIPDILNTKYEQSTPLSVKGQVSRVSVVYIKLCVDSILHVKYNQYLSVAHLNE